MFLSIVVPIYNVEEFLEKCIESILSQSFKDYELILVDDGSTDKSGEICEFYSQKDKRIKVIHKQNGGLSSARNAGIDLATGNFIAFIDSDDYIREDMFEVLTKLAIENNADIVQCEYEDIYDNMETLEQNDDQEKVRIVDNLEALSWLDNNDISIFTIVAWNKIYKRELFSDIRYPNGKIHEDEFTNYKLLYKSKKIVHVNKKLYFYRHRKTSITGTKYNKKRLDLLEALNNRLCFFRYKPQFKSIYIMTIKQYSKYLIACYYLYSEVNSNDKATLNQIKKRGKEVYWETLKYAGIILKIKMTLFLISPTLFEKLRILKSKKVYNK